MNSKELESKANELDRAGLSDLADKLRLHSAKKHFEELWCKQHGHDYVEVVDPKGVYPKKVCANCDEEKF